MNIDVKYFGMIAEAVKCTSEQLQIEVNHQLNLRNYFEEKYPSIKKINYKIAINKQINDIIKDDQNNAEVALLPPFAGG
jgi:molybdopterin converting factor small subunit